MSEELIIKHCSPTLAGLKTGNMFACDCGSEEELKEQIRYFNKMLSKKGLCVVPLRHKEGRALLYVYRPKKLRDDLRNETAQKLLCERGYPCCEQGRCIACLMKRLQESEEFPHEVGLFLGYPPDDVRGFIENKDDFKFIGHWKVYTDEENAKKTFAKFKKCTKVYSEKWKEGRSIERLTVAV